MAVGKKRVSAICREKTATDEVEGAYRLIVQDKNYGTFALLCGPEPFHLLWRHRLFQCFELEEGKPETSICMGHVRIFNYGEPANNEVGFEVTARGTITDPFGKEWQPEDLLSLDNAPSGWEAHGLIPGYGSILSEWLVQQRG